MEFSASKSRERHRKKASRKEQSYQKRIIIQNSPKPDNSVSVGIPNLPKLSAFLSGLEKIQISYKLKECAKGIHIQSKNGKKINIECSKSIGVDVLDTDISQSALFCKINYDEPLDNDDLICFCIILRKNQAQFQIIDYSSVLSHNIQTIKALHEYNTPIPVKGIKGIKYDAEENHFLKQPGSAFHNYRTYSSNRYRYYDRHLTSWKSAARLYQEEITFHSIPHALIGNSWYEIHKGKLTISDEIIFPPLDE